MIRIVSLVALVALAFSVSARAEEPPEQKVHEVARAYADCSAFYTYLSELTAAAHEPTDIVDNNAKGMRRLAIFTLMLNWKVAHNGEAPRESEPFRIQVDEWERDSMAKYRKFGEQSDFASLDAGLDQCNRLLPGAFEMLRDLDAHDRSKGSKSP